MHVYEIQKDNGLKLVQQVPEVHFSIDNLLLTQSGDALLTGAHSIPHKILTHLSDPHHRAPSSVLRLPLAADGRVVVDEITELFHDHGDLISGSTAAHIHSGQLLIGSVIDKLVVCDLYMKQQPAKNSGKK
ncbi:serum paraoxonase/arylesterase 2 [Elysia marginata]|uniref:Serum paraoxonase/arylesterase 2 n=1 Tax=Elysia marginata TaxID=1093978 RepID=A0AAV4IKH9_9GAST|nr:serum paraoxonase/arylesterase 2 [Elysia marginata]